MSFEFGINLSSSQDSNLSEGEMNGMVEESKAQSTKRATSWGMNKFKKWLDKRAIVIDLKTVGEEQFNEVLRKFYAEVKNEKKGLLTPSALTGIRTCSNPSCYNCCAVRKKYKYN